MDPSYLSALLSARSTAAASSSSADAQWLQRQVPSVANVGSDYNTSIINALAHRQQQEIQQKSWINQQIASASPGGHITPPTPGPLTAHEVLVLSMLQQQLQGNQQLQSSFLLERAGLQGTNPFLTAATRIPVLPSLPQVAAANAANAMIRVTANSELERLDDQQLARLALLRQQHNTSSVDSSQIMRHTIHDSTSAALTLPPVRKRKGRTGTFPQKLHQILTDLDQQGRSDIASFMPHGRAFGIHKPIEFAEEIMPKYFRMSHFSSLQRQLNLYDFQRITEGVDKGGYYHELFVRGQIPLSFMMKRSKIKKAIN